MLRCWLSEVFFETLSYVSRKGGKKQNTTGPVFISQSLFSNLPVFKAGSVVRVWVGRWTCYAGELGRAGLGERPQLGNKKCWGCSSPVAGADGSSSVSLDLKLLRLCFALSSQELLKNFPSSLKGTITDPLCWGSCDLAIVFLLCLAKGRQGENLSRSRHKMPFELSGFY